MDARPSDRPISERSLRLDPQVALRPEPFGALAYHYGNRRLVFLKHPDLVRVVRALGDEATVADTLVACGIDTRRWPSFERALSSLLDSEMLHDHCTDICTDTAR
ncbi:MAG: mycofactocin biosynthesis chaperone MftB [Ilumatobacteraceae bacterium]